MPWPHRHNRHKVKCPPPPRRSEETERLIDFFTQEMEDGDFVPYETLTMLIAMDTQDYRSKGRRRVQTAIRIVGDNGVNCEVRPGGVYKLLKEEYFQTTTKTLRRTRKAASRALRKTARGMGKEVDSESRERLGAERVALALHVYASKPAQTEKIRRNLEDSTEHKALHGRIDFKDLFQL